MSIKDRIRTWLGVDERQLTPAQVWGSGGIWRPFSASGVAVTVETAMKAAQGACIRLLADDIAGLPVDVYRKVGGRPVPMDAPPWVTAPSGARWYLWPTYISEVVVSLLSDGNAFVRCWPSTINPQVLTVLDPATVQVDAPGKFRIGGVDGYTDLDIMHIPWVTLPGKLRGINVVEAAEDTSGLEIAARQWEGAFFRNGGTLGGMIEVPGGPETVNADDLRSQFEARHTGPENYWKPGVLTGGAKFNSSAITPQAAELGALWKHVLEEAARLYHIPPHLMASQDPGGSSYASVEQKSIEYVVHAVVNVTTRLERPHSLLIPGDDTFIKLNVNALLRGDMAARASFYSIMLTSKVMKREEVRDKEDLPYDGELGYLETPNNNSGAPAADEPRVLISDVALRDGAEQQLTERVAAAAEATLEQASVDMAQFTVDVTQQAERIKADAAADRAALIEQQKRDEAARLAAERLPRERVVSRDGQGRIVGVVERKGEDVRRTAIERDEVGNVIRIVDVAA